MVKVGLYGLGVLFSLIISCGVLAIAAVMIGSDKDD